jgi:C-terminal processing protease CtpA/Prc
LIEKIDGTNTLDMTIGDVIALLRGHRDQPVTLEYRLPGATAAPDTTVSANTDTNIPPEHTEANVDQTAQSYTIKLKRSLMQMPKTGITEEWPLQLAYMKINGIYDGSGSYAVKQLQDWATQNIAGVILDLRSAGGADLPSVAEIGSLFAQEGQPLFRVIAADNREPVTYSSNKSSPLPVPVMALIDADTSGAAACLAAVLRNARGAMLIGAACPHDLVVRTPVPLADGRVLFIATQQIELLPPTELPPMLTPDVQIPAGVSLPPPPESKKTDDIFVQITDQERQERALTERIGQDAVLRRAADILLGLKALGIKAD